MNKQLLILLVAFVAVNAFVKRDADVTTPANYLEEAQAKLQEFANKVNDQLKDTFDAEKMKTELNKIVDTINNAINKPKESQAAA